MQTIQLSVLPAIAASKELLRKLLAEAFNTSNFEFSILKRSIDARRKPVKINLKIAVYFDGETHPKEVEAKTYQQVRG